MASGTGKTYSGKPSGTAPSVGVPPARKLGGGGDGASSEALKKAEDKVAELQMNNETLDREREFYFGKLRDIEEML